MKKVVKGWTLEVLGLALALPLAFACGGDGEGNGGPPTETPLGQELASIAGLADQFIGENAAAYEGLAFAAGALEGAFGVPAASAALRTKQDHCIPLDLQDTTLEYDPPSGMYVPGTIPGGPAGGVRIFIYEIDQGTPNTDQNIGSLDVTCSGILPNVSVMATLTVNGVNVLNINGDLSIFDVSSYQVTVAGFLRNADGSQQINFQDSGGSMSSFDSNFGVTFTVGERTFATLSRFVDSTGGQSVFINVRRESQELFEEFLFDANPFGTGDVVSGPAFFTCNRDDGCGVDRFGARDIVACLEGTFENMSVLEASESCSDGFSTLLPLGEGDRMAIKDAYQGLQGMYAAVEGVSTAGAAIALAALAEMNQ